MIFRRFCIAMAIALLTSSLALADDQQPAPRPGLITRFLNVFRGTPKAAAQPKTVATREVMTPHKIAVRLDISPLPVKLAEIHELKVTLVVTNRGKKLVHMEFPTTQRIEVLVRDQNGKQITQWSEDQSFENEITYVAINPGERIEYSVNLATRDMAAGQSFAIEAYFPAYPDIKAAQNITPEK